MSAPCLFCEIAAGRTEAAVIYQDAGFLAFLDHRPLFPGHTLLVPKAHWETLVDLPAQLTGPLSERARALSAAVQQGLGAQGTFVAINNRISQSVPHLHVHIVPRREKDGLKGFFWPRTKYESAEVREQVRNAIRSAMAGLDPAKFPMTAL